MRVAFSKSDGKEPISYGPIKEGEKERKVNVSVLTNSILIMGITVGSSC